MTDVALPQTRQLTAADGIGWLVTVDRGRLRLTRPADGTTVVFEDPAELRWFGMQLHRAATEADLDVQLAAAKASADRRLARQRAGQPTGLRHGPFTEPPEPPIHADLETA